MSKKIYIVFFLLLIFSTALIHANEVKFNFKSNKSLDVQEIYKTSNIDFLNFKSENNNLNFFGRRAGLGMAVAGTVLVGTSMFFIIPGMVLMIYGYENRWTYFRNYYTYGWYQDLTLVYVGAGVLTLGLIMLFTGLPLMIIGFIIYRKRGRRTSLFIDGNNNAANMGVKIRI